MFKKSFFFSNENEKKNSFFKNLKTDNERFKIVFPDLEIIVSNQ